MFTQFTGQLTAGDSKRHLSHRFTLPADCSTLTIQLHFAPHQVESVVGNFTNMLTLTLFAPNGFRGAGHRGGDTHLVTIDHTNATPGYLAGHLPAGEWNAQIDTHMILPGLPVSYTLEVSALEDDKVTGRQGDAKGITPLPTPHSALCIPHWYRGDLHSHTFHSDGGRSVAELVQTAKDYKLDFIFLTDHNTTSPLAEMAGYTSPELLTLGGMELTTFYGHALCLGTHEWIDWRVRPGSDEMAQIAAATYARDQLFIIAHPCAIGDPGCTGCKWTYFDLLPGPAKLVEIWNTAWVSESNNEQALQLWYSWLNAGHRLVATAGSDAHRATDYANKPGFCWVYAEERSQLGILRGLLAGHLYLSSGPQLTFTAHTPAGATVMMGDVVADGQATLHIAWNAAPVNSVVRLIANGKLYWQSPAGESGEANLPITAQAAHWCVLELRNAAGEIEAITNPIYLT